LRLEGYILLITSCFEKRNLKERARYSWTTPGSSLLQLCTILGEP